MMSKKVRQVTLTPFHAAHFHTGHYNRKFLIEPQLDGTLRVNSVYCGTHVKAEHKAGFGMILTVVDAATPPALTGVCGLCGKPAEPHPIISLCPGCDTRHRRLAAEAEQTACDNCRGCSGEEPIVCPLDDGQGEWGHYHEPPPY